MLNSSIPHCNLAAVILLVLAALGVGYAGFLVWRDDVKPQTPDERLISQEGASDTEAANEEPKEETAAIPDLSISDWETHRSKNFGYVVRYPANWEVDTLLATDQDFGLFFVGPLSSSFDLFDDGISITIDFSSNKDLSLSEWLIQHDAKKQCMGWNKEIVTNQGIQGIRRHEKCRGWSSPSIRYYFPLEDQRVVLMFTIIASNPDPLLRARYLLTAETVYETFRLPNDFSPD